MTVSAKRLNFAYTNTPILREITFTIADDAVVFILGHNGCGKSTLFNCLAGVYTPQSGEVLLDGVNAARLTPRQRAQRIGLVPQNHAAAFPYSVLEMVVMGRAPHLGLFATPGREDGRLAEEALASVGLTSLAERSFNELSGGERRLVMVARGLAQNSGTLLLDEPDAYLDPHNQYIVMETVTRLARSGRCFVVTSHSPNNALLYADRVILMKQGAIVADGGPDQVLTESLLEAAYGMPFDLLRDPGPASRTRAILPRRASIPR